MKSHTKNENWIHPRVALIAGIVLSAAALRIVPHPMNFTPIGALALFGGAYFSSKRAAVAVPLLSLVAGDIFAGFHRLMPYVYASFLVSVAIGFWLRDGGAGFSLQGLISARTGSASLNSAPRLSRSRLAVATVAGAIQFFLVSNFAMWVTATGTYPKTASGLAECYLAGIPLFWNTLAGDAFYVTLFFGVMALAENWLPSLRAPLSSDPAELS